jgi:LCP family protein required for cell wall assembly
MMRRDRRRNHAVPTARAKRIRSEAEREAAMRAAGEGDPSPWGASRDRRTETQVLSAPGPETRPRKRTSVKRVVLTGSVLLIAILVIGSVLLWQRVSAFNAATSSRGTLSSALFGPLGGHDRVNILMIGYSGDPKHGGTYLADSLNILSIDPGTKTTTLIPIPRDLWIEGLPEMPNNGKVNEAFADGWDAGGWENAGAVEAAVVSKVTGLTIDHFIAIDFAGLSDVVDAVGGVTVANPRAFQYTWWEGNYQRGSWSGSFKAGPIHLDGQEALTYARARYTSVPAESSDFARSVRQQRIISALRDNLGSGIGSLGPGLAVMDALKGHLHTDLSAIDLFLLSGHLHVDRRLELKEDVALKAGRNSAGSYILFPVGADTVSDYAPLQRFIAAGLAKPIPSPSPTPSPTPAS